MVDTTTTLSATTAGPYYDRELLYRAKQAQVFYDAAQKKNLKKNAGKVISWRRYNALAVNTTPLSEGVTPTSTALSQTEITATINQYGAWASISDVLDMVSVDPIAMEAYSVMGQMAGESIDTLVQDVVEAGTSVIYATGSARSSQASTNVLTLNLIRKAIRVLDANNTRRFNGPEMNDRVGVGHYLLFAHPNQIFDLQNDTEWKNHQQYQAKEKLYNGEIGEILGVRILQSTLAPVYVDAGASSADVYAAILVGQNAYGVVDFSGSGRFESITKAFGSGGTSDALNQRATVGWKSMFASKILNNNFMVRIETGATDQV